MRYPVRTVLLAVACCCSGAAFAEGSLRCGTHLVEQGMSREKVRERCGDPDGVQQSGRVWIYDTGRNEFLHVVTFVQEEVQFVNEEPRSTYPSYQEE